MDLLSRMITSAGGNKDFPSIQSLSIGHLSSYSLMYGRTLDTDQLCIWQQLWELIHQFMRQPQSTVQTYSAEWQDHHSDDHAYHHYFVFAFCGGIFKGNFDLFYNLVGNNGLLYNKTDVIDTLTFRALISSQDFGMSRPQSALYQSVLCFVTIVMIVNRLVSKYDKDTHIILKDAYNEFKNKSRQD